MMRLAGRARGSDLTLRYTLKRRLASPYSGFCVSPRHRGSTQSHSQGGKFGDLPKIIGNEENLYEGNLIYYFRVLFFRANNLYNPYHNFRHMSHVLWLCYKACQYYSHELPPRQMRTLLIAALFHDFDHTGRPHRGDEDPDGINIEIAISGLRRYLASDDRALMPEIEALIEATHFPYRVDSQKLDLLGKIIRDADLAQALSPVWIQQVVIGLAREAGVSPLAMLKAQSSFLTSLRFNTPWAQQLFPQELIDAKIAEAEKLLRLLEGDDPIDRTSSFGEHRI